MTWEIRCGHVLDRLREMEPESVRCVVTSPPYFGLRDYGTAAWDGGDQECEHKGEPLISSRSTLAGYTSEDVKLRTFTMPQGQVCAKCGARRVDAQIGLEASPLDYVAALVEVFREVRRILRLDGVVFLNLGDSYASSPPGNTTKGVSGASTLHGVNGESGRYRETLSQSVQTKRNTVVGGLKPKDLVGIPWMVAFALRADGWWLRSDIIWHKPNPMPESVTDRPTKAHEYLFLLTKSATYFYDAEAVKEPALRAGDIPGGDNGRGVGIFGVAPHAPLNRPAPAARNLRDVWTIATRPFPESHFATFPKALVEPCIKAGTSEKGCCPECRAPWVREVERGALAMTSHTRQAPTYRGDARRNPAMRPDAAIPNAFYPSRTSGWRSTCSHDAEPVPCTVLDPFCGSGTAGVVAVQLGRSFIGIDLSPTYCEMAERRIHNEGGLFSVVNEGAS